MSEMTLPSRHRIQNSNTGGLRPSTLPFGHGGSPQYRVLGEDGEETFLCFSNRRDRETNPKFDAKGSGANHYSRAPAQGRGAHGLKKNQTNGESPVLRDRTSRISAYK